jgi:hypothetical protein
MSSGKVARQSLRGSKRLPEREGAAAGCTDRWSSSLVSAIRDGIQPPSRFSQVDAIPLIFSQGFSTVGTDKYQIRKGYRFMAEVAPAFI